MTFPWIVGVEAIAFTATFVLSFHDAVASEDYTEDNRQVRECTEHGLARCYMHTTSAVPWEQLQPNDNGEFNAEAYREACRVLNETSPCYEGSNRCPPSMRSNFTRREEGYRAFRALVCDTDVLKAMMTTSTCTSKDKLGECTRNEISSFNATGSQHEEVHCRIIQAQNACFEKSWNSSCPIALESAWETFNKSMDAIELINDCKSMYPNASNAANATRSQEVTLSDLAIDVAEMKVLLRENAQAIASLTLKVKQNSETLKQQVASMESMDGALHALRGLFSRRYRTHQDDPESSQA